MKNRKFLKTLWKKKANHMIAATLIFVPDSTIFAINTRIHRIRVQEAGTSAIQSTAVTISAISNTIDASDNLKVTETIDITVLRQTALES